ncbi:MAG TPA: FAD/NAD(P)-binding oxidoreductase [Mycobacterium sp.]|nr:FAD/NAD(P)-binding oxidoreductase [Mycobacterium sp.]
MSKTVVVLGAGTGGVAAAERLRSNLPPSDQVVLVDRSFTGSLGLSSLRVLRGWRTPAEVVRTVRPDALPGVSLVTGEVVDVDTAARVVHYRGSDPGAISYDGLVVALGATLNTTAVPGLDAALASGVASEFYSAAGAAELHRRIDGLASGRIVVLITALPFKCPPAPYEAAFLIADQLGERFTSGAVRVDVITCEPRPIGVARPEVGKAVVGMLRGNGIGFHAEKVTRAVDPEARTIEFADGGTESFDLLAAVPPHSSPAAAVLPGMVNAGGWIPVDPATLATGTPGVWAVGDNTVVPLAHGMPLPKAGIFADGAAVVAADQLARYLGYDAPDSRFTAEGGCLMVVSSGLAAKIAGRFLAAPEPLIGFYGPSDAFFTEKEEQERDWLTRWG